MLFLEKTVYVSDQEDGKDVRRPNLAETLNGTPYVHKISYLYLFSKLDFGSFIRRGSPSH